MRIIRARHEDVPEIVKMGRKFWQQTTYYQKHYVKYNDEQVTKLVHNLIDNGIVQIVKDEDTMVGMILIVVAVCPFNPVDKIGTELGYYMDPKCRGQGAGYRLLRQAENVARQQGVKILNMISIDGPDLDTIHTNKLYESLGYRNYETTFTKEL